MVYWVVYSILTCIEYFGHGLFTGFVTCIEFIVHSLFYLSYFYWLAKCLFLLWFAHAGAQIISRMFTGDSEVSEDTGDNAADVNVEESKFNLLLILIIS